MKRFIMLLGLILVLSLLPACSSKPSLKLIDSTVSIVNDKSKTGSIGITIGDKKGQMIVPTALYYEFVIKNVGNRTIGEKGMRIAIVPNDKLKAKSEEIMGFNIYDPISYEGTGLGYGGGGSAHSILRPGEEGTFSIYYLLGVNEENPNVAVMTPPRERLKELKDNSLDVTLVGFTEMKKYPILI